MFSEQSASEYRPTFLDFINDRLKVKLSEPPQPHVRCVQTVVRDILHCMQKRNPDATNKWKQFRLGSRIYHYYHYFYYSYYASRFILPLGKAREGRSHNSVDERKPKFPQQRELQCCRYPNSCKISSSEQP